MCSTDIFLGLLAVVFPPLAVWVKRGIFSADSIINILLCVLGFVPGLIHAWYIIIKYPEPDYDYEVLNQDAEGGRVAYYVVQPALPGPRPSPSPSHSHSHRHGRSRSYNQNPIPSGSRRVQGASSSHHITTTSVAGDSNVPSPVAAPTVPKIQANMNYGTASSVARPGPSAGGYDAGEGRSDGPPPSYAQTVAGDNKIQSQD